MTLHILRQVTDDQLSNFARNQLAQEAARIQQIPDKGDLGNRTQRGNPKAYRPGSGLVDNDYPRDSDVNDALISLTEGFLLTDDGGRLLAQFGPTDLGAAEKARSGAKVTVSYDVALAPEDKPAKTK